MATFYVDKRAVVNGNGSQGSPYNRINEVCGPSIGANAVIEIVAGSGPYIYGLDFGYLSQPNLYLNHSNLGTVTWNFNGNKITSCKELVGDTNIIWVQSSFDTTMFYCTNTSGGNPNIGAVVSAVIDDDWNALSTSLFGQYPNSGTTRFTKKWGYGDKDILGFNTVYIKGIDPSEAQNITLSIYNTDPIKLDTTSNPASEIFNDMYIEGGGDLNVRLAAAPKITFNRCHFSNSDKQAVYAALNAPIEFNYCYFLNTGHEAWHSPYATTANNCVFENCHVITKLISTTEASITTIRNCKTKNLLAGGLQFDTASVQTLIEDHNQWHIDPDSTHGGMAIAFAVNGGRQWTITDPSDFPPSQDTSTQVYVSPETVPEGSGSTITGLHDQATAAKDYNGDNVLFLTPNMGHVDGRKTKIISSIDYAPTGYEVRSPAKLVITGGGDINLSGLTDTGAIDVIATAGSTIKAFTGNGINTNLKAIATNKAPGYSRNLR